MIRFVTAPGHHYTFKGIVTPPEGVRRPPVQIWDYRRLFEAAELPRGTWIFCDHERLGIWELRLAGEIARLLREAGPGFQILNDPAVASARYELLLRLHSAGFNNFRAWRAEDGLPPARYPVFLRLETNHGSPLTGLIHSPETLAGAFQELRNLGISRRGVLVIEYQAEEFEPGIFRKFSAYRFGDRIVADHIVYDITWLAKYGNKLAMSDERFALETIYVRDNPHRDALMRGFEIAGLEYGRADYGLVGDEVQIWEINTNPFLPAGDASKAPPQRVEATLTSRENRLNAIAALDSHAEGPDLVVDSALIRSHLERQNPAIPDMIRY